MADKKKPRKGANAASGRDYTYDLKYQSSPEQKANRAARGRARYEMEKKGKVKKGDGKDVAHEKPLSEGGSNSASNLKVQSIKKNRGRVGKDGKHR